MLTEIDEYPTIRVPQPTVTGKYSVYLALPKLIDVALARHSVTMPKKPKKLSSEVSEKAIHRAKDDILEYMATSKALVDQMDQVGASSEGLREKVEQEYQASLAKASELHEMVLSIYTLALQEAATAAASSELDCTELYNELSMPDDKLMDVANSDAAKCLKNHWSVLMIKNPPPKHQGLLFHPRHGRPAGRMGRRT